jgi:hypothetical protein
LIYLRFILQYHHPTFHWCGLNQFQFNILFENWGTVAQGFGDHTTNDIRLSNDL